MYTGIEQYLKRKWLSVLLSNILFGLMHWVRRSSILDSLLYTFFAILAGTIYNVCYILADNSVLAAALMHTIVDTVWEYAFR